MAKGTTSEKGLVTSYFANPFGPVQKQKETDILIDKFFNKMYDDKVVVGQIRTMLGIKGKEHEGPIKAAEKLFQKETDILIDKFFNKMYDDKVVVGQIRTMLGIKGKEHEGPIKAAEKLFNLIMKK